MVVDAVRHALPLVPFYFYRGQTLGKEFSPIFGRSGQRPMGRKKEAAR